MERAIAELLAVGPDAAGADKAQKAVDALVASGPKTLPAILAAIPSDDVVKANWLRVAFNRIVDDAVREKKTLPTDELLSFVNDKKKPGRSRRLALEAVEGEHDSGEGVPVSGPEGEGTRPAGQVGVPPPRRGPRRRGRVAAGRHSHAQEITPETTP